MGNKFLSAGVTSPKPQAPAKEKAQDLDTAADEAMAEYDAQEEANSEVQYRLAKANYYLAVINEPLFPDNAPEAAIEVENEIRDFAEARLRKFLGMSGGGGSNDASPAAVVHDVQLPFDEQQTQALTLWANKLLKRDSQESGLLQRSAPIQAPAPAAPVVRTEAPAPAPQTRPAEATQSLRRRPGRPPGTGKHQRAAQTVQKTEETAPPAPAGPPVKKPDGAITLNAPTLPPPPGGWPENVFQGDDGRMYQEVEIMKEGKVVKKITLYQIPLRSETNAGVPMPPPSALETTSPVLGIRVASGQFRNPTESMSPQIMEKLTNHFLKK